MRPDKLYEDISDAYSSALTALGKLEDLGVNVDRVISRLDDEISETLAEYDEHEDEEDEDPRTTAPAETDEERRSRRLAKAQENIDKLRKQLEEQGMSREKLDRLLKPNQTN